MRAPEHFGPVTSGIQLTLQQIKMTDCPNRQLSVELSELTELSDTFKPPFLANLFDYGKRVWLCHM